MKFHRENNYFCTFTEMENNCEYFAGRASEAWKEREDLKDLPAPVVFLVQLAQSGLLERVDHQVQMVSQVLLDYLEELVTKDLRDVLDDKEEQDLQDFL